MIVALPSFPRSLKPHATVKWCLATEPPGPHHPHGEARLTGHRWQTVSAENMKTVRTSSYNPRSGSAVVRPRRLSGRLGIGSSLASALLQPPSQAHRHTLSPTLGASSRSTQRDSQHRLVRLVLSTNHHQDPVGKINFAAQPCGD